MRKIICCILCLLLLVSFSACEDPDGVRDLGTQNHTESATVTDSANTQESSPETDENDGWTNIY